MEKCYRCGEGEATIECDDGEYICQSCAEYLTEMFIDQNIDRQIDEERGLNE